jgi:hypothetical protein
MILQETFQAEVPIKSGIQEILMHMNIDSPVTNSTIAFDHLFICTAIGAPEAEHLISLGLREGRSNIHRGQGTANRCFFFRNFMLELLWVEKPEEAQSDVITPTHLWERWSNRAQEACPFGLCLRSNTPDEIPFATWDYCPPYKPDSLRLSIATNSNNVTEPMLFHLHPSKRPDCWPTERLQPLEHSFKIEELTHISLIGAYANAPSPELLAVRETLPMDLTLGTEHLIKLFFDSGIQQQHIDCRPVLPLILGW